MRGHCNSSDCFCTEYVEGLIAVGACYINSIVWSWLYCSFLCSDLHIFLLRVSIGLTLKHQGKVCIHVVIYEVFLSCLPDCVLVCTSQSLANIDDVVNKIRLKIRWVHLPICDTFFLCILTSAWPKFYFFVSHVTDVWMTTSGRWWEARPMWARMGDR